MRVFDQLNQVDERAVNTVVDVALALLFVGAAVAMLVGFPPQDEDDHQPAAADQTIDTVGASTTDVTYSTEAVAAAVTDDLSGERLQRISHGSAIGQLVDAAVANVEFGDGQQLTDAGHSFEAKLDERVQTSLVDASFETNVTAVWRPYDGAAINGRATVGPTPPEHDAVSTSTMTVPSGFASVRSAAIDAANRENDYEPVARLLADSVIEGYLPAVESKRTLESSGLERERTVHRYERMATVIEDADPDDLTVSSNIELHSVDTKTANSHLVEKLTGQLETVLADEFDSPAAAAAGVSVGEVTITVRTWEP